MAAGQPLQGNMGDSQISGFVDDANASPTPATLNAYDGGVTNNMAIVATTTGSISVFPSGPTHLVLDIFGYFAP
jgi:hypothetical protein